MRFMMPAVAAFAAVASVPASAAIVSGNVYGGSAYTLGSVFQEISAPAVSGNHNQQSNNLLGWEEQQGVTLTQSIAANLGLTTIPAGTWISSDVITMDPVSGASVRATVTFNAPILAVIYSGVNLLASDWLSTGTTYSTVNGRGLETFDINNTYISGNTLYLTWSSSNAGDQIRVITGVVPEAATWAMMITGFGLVGAAARRRRSAPAVRS